MKNQPLLAAALIIQVVSATLAQQTTQPPPAPSPSPQTPADIDVVRISTNLVQFDAVVTDKSGKLVTDLKPEEVEIYEDGNKQKITHFSYYEAETTTPELSAKSAPADKNAPPVPPTRLKLEDVRRTIAIVVDDLGLSFESTAFVRRALKKFVDEQMQPGDLVAIIRTSGGMGALQQFTMDKRQLYAAVERVKWNALGRGGVTAVAPMESPAPNSGGANDSGAQMDAANQDFNEFREDVFAVGTLGALSYVVQGLKDLPGRKSILLVSDGFRIYNLNDPNKDYLALERLRRLVDQANRASVVVYTINATGLQTLGLTAADQVGDRTPDQLEQQLTNRRNAAWETQDGLNYLAHETGGIAIHNTNDLSGGIRKVLADQRGYYLIGFRPDNTTFDPRTGRRTFHKLSLKVTRPGKFNVRMRQGFYGVTDTERAQPKTLGQEMVSALTSPFGSTGVHLQLTSLFANDPKVGSFMRSFMHIDGHDLTFTEEPDKTHKCVFDVMAITFGENGTVVEQPVGKTYTLRMTDDTYKRAVRDGIVYYVTVPVKKAGAYQLRISLRDSATDRLGSASQFIEVPDLKKNRLALSGIVVRGLNANQTSTTNASAANQNNAPVVNPNQTDEGTDSGSAEASPVVRHIRQGMNLAYGFVIYNAHVDKNNSQPRLTTQVRVFRGSTLVFTGKENPFNVSDQSDPKRLIAGGRIRIGTDLEPGEYALQVIVTDLNADEKHRTTTQWMDFEIVK